MTKEKSIIQQANKMIRHNNQGSYATKRRYSEGYLRFCNFIGDEFKVQNVKNIRPKHVEAYVDSLKERDSSVSYIKTDLAAIRFFHDKIDNPRYEKLPNNDELNIENRSYRGIDRKWSEGEIESFKAICMDNNKEWIADAIDISSEVGLRIHEVVRINREDLESALELGYIETKGKGGKVREVPISDDIRPVFDKLIDQTDKYSKVFVEEGQKSHNVHRDIQKFIRDHRDEVRTSIEGENRPPMTFHGLRHSYANNKYKEAVENGYERVEAEKEVSKLIGHNRAEVTRIYTT